MIVNVVKDWHAEGCPTTPEAIEHANRVVEGATWHSFNRNFIVQERDENRAPVTLSSNFYCSRLIAYDMIGGHEEERFTLDTRNKFGIGDMVEVWTIAQIILAFHWHDDYEIINPMYAGDQLTVNATFAGDELGGRPDLVFRFKGNLYVADIKSMNDMSFGFAMRGKDIPENMKGKIKPPYYSDKFGRRTQLANYIVAVEAVSGFFVGVSKGDGKMFEDEVTLEEATGLYKNAYLSYTHAKTHVSCDEIPSRPPWATENLVKGAKPWKGEIAHVRCSYCKRRPVCWPEHTLAPLKGQVKYRRNLSDAEAENFHNNPAE